MTTLGARKQFAVTGAAVLLSASTLLVATPTTTNPTSFHASLLIETFLATISVAGGLLFLTSLGAFKVKLRVAYTLIAAGMVLYALALVQLPFLQAMNLFYSNYVTNGWLELMYVAAAILLLVGVLRYARLMQVRSKSLHPLTITTTAVVMAGLALLMPHSGNFYHTLFALEVNVSLVTISAVLLTFAAVALLLVKRAAGPAYTNALAWSFIGVGLLAVSTYSTAYFQLSSFVGLYVSSGLFFVPFLLAVSANLRSAVAFNNISRY
jgi:hypothetical protein